MPLTACTTTAAEQHFLSLPLLTDGAKQQELVCCICQTEDWDVLFFVFVFFFFCKGKSKEYVGVSAVFLSTGSQSTCLTLEAVAGKIFNCS